MHEGTPVRPGVAVPKPVEHQEQRGTVAVEFLDFYRKGFRDGPESEQVVTS